MQTSQVVFTVIFEADSFSFLPQLSLCKNAPGKTRRVFTRVKTALPWAMLTAMSKQGRPLHLCWATPWVARQRLLVPDRGPGKDWDLTTREKQPLLNLSELPQWRMDYSIIIFRHLSLLDTSQRDTGLLNFPTPRIAETGTWDVFELFGFDKDLNDEHLKWIGKLGSLTTEPFSLFPTRLHFCPAFHV